MITEFQPFLRFISKTAYFIDSKVVAGDCRILYIISGYGSFETEGVTYKLSPNTLIYYPYNVPYHIRADGADGMLFYTLNFDFSQEYTDIAVLVPTEKLASEERIVLPSIAEELQEIFSKIIYREEACWARERLDQIYAEFLNQKKSHVLVQNSLLRIVLIDIYRNKAEELPRNHQLIEKIKMVIEKNLSWKVNDVARELGYHPYYLNEVLKKQEGITIHSYLQRQRLIRAKELITTTQLPFSEIALICGFGSQSHFSAAFKKTYGMTPYMLRRKL